MSPAFDIRQDQIGFRKLLLYHFYPGVLVLVFYILFSTYIVDLGYPGLAGLLLAELVILAPVEFLHMLAHGKRLNGRFSLHNVIGFTEKLSLKQYITWSLIGLVACFLIYIPLYPAGLFLRESVFAWLPEWYFNPVYGSSDISLIGSVFLAGILIDGIIGPVAEELFFRGYLLPRMADLKQWAWILNGLFFGLYHFWQPHNYLAVVGVGMVISYVVWKKRNVYLGIVIHCTLNILGAIGGYLAVTSGQLPVR
jgi:membrane protease YdiL (CAAX protease family)